MILQASGITIQILGEFSIERRIAPACLQQMRTLIGPADLVIASLEGPLSDEGEAALKPVTFCAPPEAAQDLAALGVEVVALATNHALDFGVAAMQGTWSALAGAGIRHAGTGQTLEQAAAPVSLTVNGRSVAVLSFACTIPVGWAAGPREPGIAPLRIRSSFVVDEQMVTEQPGTPPEVHSFPDDFDMERVASDVRTAKEQHDIVIVLPHWGVVSSWRVPNHPVIQEYQRIVAHALIDAGADAVVGHHAQELHGIELYRGRPILYCAGLFWLDTFPRWQWLRRQAATFRLVFPAEDGACQLYVDPLVMDDLGIPYRDVKRGAIAELNRLSRQHGVQIDGSGRVVEM